MYHTLLLKSDGAAVACGRNYEGQCNIPPLKENLSYVRGLAGPRNRVVVLQASYDGHTLKLLRIGGDSFCEIITDVTVRLSEVQRQLAKKLNIAPDVVEVVFHGGELLNSILACEASAVLARVAGN